LTDQACLESEYSKVCVKPGISFDSCMTWIRAVEQSPNADVRATAAAIYMLMSPRAPENARTEMHARAARLIHEVLDAAPTNHEALLGLANLAETTTDRVSALRRAAAAEPTDAMGLYFLARALAENESGLPEAAELLERAYSLDVERQRLHAWHLARDAMSVYERAGQPDRSADLRARVRKDADLDAMLLVTTTAASVAPERLDAVLADLCSQLGLEVLGAESCLDAIGRVVDGSNRAPRSVAKRVAESASNAMFLAARAGWLLDTVDPNWRPRFEATLAKHFGSDAAARMRDAPTEITVE